MPDNTKIAGYWRQDLPRLFKRTRLSRGLSSYWEALTGKNITRAMDFDKALMAKKTRVDTLFNKELGKVVDPKNKEKLTHLLYQDIPKGDIGARNKAWDKITKIVERDRARGNKIVKQVTGKQKMVGSANPNRLKALSEINEKLKHVEGPSLITEKMRTEDARVLTGLVGAGGLYAGGSAIKRSYDRAHPIIPPQDMSSLYGYGKTAMQKTALSNGIISDAIYGRLRDAMNSKSLDKAHKTTRQILRMYTPLEKRMGSSGANRLAISVSRYFSSLAPRATKVAGEENEPVPETHTNAPEQKLRPRAEVIIYTKEGVWGIKKDGYMLLPGGGIAEGERPAETAAREALEEADRVCLNIEARDTVSTIYDKNVFSFKDWDGEKTYFHLALDGGAGNMNHKDKEEFSVIPYGDIKWFINDLLNDKKQEWAHENNMRRLRIIEEAERKTREEHGLEPHKYASLYKMSKPQDMESAG